MFLKQYYLGCLAHASYLIADEAGACAIVVDPQRDVQQYLTDAERLGVPIRHVFLTHFHANFIAGHLELRDRCGADIPTFETEIEQRVAYAEALTMGRTIFEWSGRGHAVSDIQALTHELLDVLNEQNIRTGPEAKAANG